MQKKKKKKEGSMNTATSNEKISPREATSTKISKMHKWGKVNLKSSLYRGEKWAVIFPLINKEKQGP